MAERYYVLGDEVVLSVELAHLQNLEEIRVKYGKDGGLDNTITFIGELDSTEEVGTDETMESGPLRATPRRYPRKRSKVTLRTLVDVDHAPGLYVLVSLSYRTTEGSWVEVSAFDPGTTIIEGDSFHVLEYRATHVEARIKLIDED